MSNQVKGTVKMISQEIVVSEKFKKVDFVVTDNSSQYPQHIIFQCTNDKTSIVAGVKVGDELTVHFNLRGREWVSPQGEVKYFNTLEAWKVEGAQNAAPVAAAPQSAAQPAPMAAPAAQPQMSDGDLPF